MIIVSQDKDKIVNFDNLTQIYITQDEEETAYFIRFETIDSLYDDLGEYKAKERAKEVLEDIADWYGLENLKEVKFEEGLLKILARRTSTFIMPKE